MTANGNDVPEDPAAEAVRTREQFERTAEASAAKADDLKGRAQEKAVQAVQVTRDKVGEAKDKVSELTPEDAAITSPPAVRGAGVGAATIGLAVTVVIWLLRRRARRNANPVQAAARSAQSQIKTVRKEAKSSLKAVRKRSRAEAASHVAAMKAKARKARSRVKS